MFDISNACTLRSNNESRMSSVSLSCCATVDLSFEGAVDKDVVCLCVDTLAEESR